MDTETLEVDFIRESLSLLVDHVAVQAAIVVAIAFVVARLVDVVIARVILRLARKTSTTLDDRLVELVHRPLFMTVVLLGLLIALHIVAPNELAATGVLPHGSCRFCARDACSETSTRPSRTRSTTWAGSRCVGT